MVKTTKEYQSKDDYSELRGIMVYIVCHLWRLSPSSRGRINECV